MFILALLMMQVFLIANLFSVKAPLLAIDSQHEEVPAVTFF
jgi:hypothetical protein